MKLRNSLVVAACLLLLAGLPAYACHPGVMWGLVDTGFQDAYVPYLTLGPDYGFSVYACPSPFLWLSGNLSRYKAWLSTCQSGGDAAMLVDFAGDATFPSQVNVASQIVNPFDNTIQGKDFGFAYATSQSPPFVPQWIPLYFTGGPCGPVF